MLCRNNDSRPRFTDVYHGKSKGTFYREDGTSIEINAPKATYDRKIKY